ncbi:MAG: N-formylglutamate amidohydrolase [Paracoccaceae bacterium]
MNCTSEPGGNPLSQHLLSAADGPAVELINPDGQGGLVLASEHASAYIPQSLNHLGLDPDTSRAHIAWDPGALSVAKFLSALLDAPLIASRISRLVYDCNRPPTSPDAMRDKSEVFAIPGNQNLSQQDRDTRTAEVYRPFQSGLKNLLASRDRPTALVTIHSFTPTYFGDPRKTELGLLHDADARLATAMLDAAPDTTAMLTEINKPYGPEDGVTHTLIEHALPANHLNVMIEIRNDLIKTQAQCEKTATELAKMIERGLRTCHQSSINTGRGPQT